MHAAAFKGSLGMNVAFVGLSPTAVDLNPLCWVLPEVCGFAELRRAPRFPTSPVLLTGKKAGGELRVPNLPALSILVSLSLERGGRRGGKLTKARHSCKITLLRSLLYTYKAPALPCVFLSHLTQQPVVRSCCRAAKFPGTELKREGFLKKKNQNKTTTKTNPKATANC